MSETINVWLHHKAGQPFGEVIKEEIGEIEGVESVEWVGGLVDFVVVASSISPVSTIRALTYVREAKAYVLEQETTE